MTNTFSLIFTPRTYYYRCERKAVSIVRAFLAKAKAFISGDTFLDIPGYTAVFRSHPFELSETVHHKYTKLGFFEASRVYVGDLDTLEEEPDWSYHEGRSVVTIYGYLQLQDFRVSKKYPNINSFALSEFLRRSY